MNLNLIIQYPKKYLPAKITCFFQIFGFYFYFSGEPLYAVLALSLAGSLVAFLIYNFYPAKIFMGDTGSLLIGLISALMAVEFIEANKLTHNSSPAIYSAPALAFAILVGPIFDTLRVFFIRIINGIPPFTADRNHIHHRLLQLGLTHLQTTLILAFFNIMATVLVLSFNTYGNYVLVIVIFGLCLLFNWILTFLIRSKARHSHALRNLFV